MSPTDGLLGCAEFHILDDTTPTRPQVAQVPAVTGGSQRLRTYVSTDTCVVALLRQKRAGTTPTTVLSAHACAAADAQFGGKLGPTLQATHPQPAMFYSLNSRMGIV